MMGVKQTKRIKWSIKVIIQNQRNKNTKKRKKEIIVQNHPQGAAR
jgi:transcription elongation factor GreA-like protein